MKQLLSTRTACLFTNSVLRPPIHFPPTFPNLPWQPSPPLSLPTPCSSSCYFFFVLLLDSSFIDSQKKTQKLPKKKKPTTHIHHNNTPPSITYHITAYKQHVMFRSHIFLIFPPLFFLTNTHNTSNKVILLSPPPLTPFPPIAQTRPPSVPQSQHLPTPLLPPIYYSSFSPYHPSHQLRTAALSEHMVPHALSECFIFISTFPSCTI